uniref:Protein NLRC5 n=1 Tax=Capra hircus TaxID=9925 RepID=A0A8C2Y259_CAPHI
MDPISLQLGTRNLHGWLVRLLSRNLEWLDAKVKLFLPNVDLGSEYQALDPTQRAILHLQKLHTQGPTTWKSFIQCVCMELDVPMDMEVLLMSMWGHEDGKSDPKPHPLLLLSFLPGLKRTYQSCGSSPRRKQLRKQQQGRYLQLLRTSVQQRYGDRTPGLGQPLAFHQVYVPPILQWSRASAPFHTQEGATTGDPKAEDGTNVNIRDLFSTKASKGPRVTVLLGKAGMGKTTLAHWLCQKWADGELDRFQAVFLFEFRQLNLITGSLTLPQLLFDVHLRPEASPEAVFQHLKENAEGILLIFDGLDEILQPCSDKETADPEDPASALTLFSRLCRGTLLPGCWVMATSRPGKLPACLPTEAATVHMWGFDGPRVEEYVNHFFSDQLSREAALAELRVDRRLWSMCAVPALCQVACLCLHHLLPGRSPGQAAALLPSMTQNYVQMLLALDPRGVLQAEPLLGLGEVALSGLESGKVIFSTGDIPASTLAFGDALGLLTSFCVCTGPGHQDKGYAFSHLSLQEFFAALHLMTRPQVDRETLSQHVTLHSRWVQRTKARLGLSDHLPTFLAGLASRACRSFLSLLAQREEEWVAARQEIVLQALKKLATRRLTGPKIVELCHCVGETQEPELASFMAHNLPQQLPFHNFLLTYADMASLTNILGHRDGPIHLDFEGCPLEPRCPETLAGCGQVENLSFKSRKCGDAFAEALSRSLPTMGSLKKLGLAGSKITAQGISHLVQALPFCPQLEEVSFQDNQLKDKEVLNIVKVLSCLPRLQKLDLSRNNVSVSTLLSLTKVAVTCPTIRMLQIRPRSAGLLAPAAPGSHTQSYRSHSVASDLELLCSDPHFRLQKCQLGVHDVEVLIAQLQEGPQLDEVDLSGNQLKDEGCQLMAEAAPQLLSDNGLSVAGVLSVLSVVSMCQTLAELHISLLHKTVVFTFAPELEEQEGIQKSCRLGHLDLSGNALGDEGVALLARLLPGLGSLQSLNLSENRLSLEGVFSLIQCFSTLRWLLHLEFSLKECQLEPLSLSHLCKSLEKCPGPLEVQLSCEVLSDQSLETLLHHLPQLPQLSLLQLSQTQLPPRSPLLLADLFSLCPQVQKVDLRSLRHLTLHLRSSEEQEDRCCWRFTDCGLRQEHVEPLCCLLSKCEDLNQLDLSANLLGDDGLRCLLECLPKVPISGSLNLSCNSMSQESVLCLVEALPSCPRVREASVNKTRMLSECHFKPEHMPRLAASLNQALQLAELTCCFPGLEQLIVLLGLLTWPTGVLTLRVEEPWVGRARVLKLLEVCAQASGNITEISISETQQQLCIQLEFPHQENPEAVALRLAHCDLGTHQNLLARQLMETCARLRQLSLSQVNLCDASSLLLQSLLLSLSELKNFRLTYSCVSSKGLAHLASGLSHCHLLEELDLSNNQLGDEGTKVLLGALEGKCRLKRLDLSHLPLGGSTLAVLTQGLGHMTLLQSLRLSRSNIDDVGCCHLSKALRAATSLEELSLSHNQIGNTGAQDLAAVLPGLPELRKIDLSANGIGPAGGARLAESLTLCRHLEELMLGCNALEDCTALGLAKGLPRHLRVLHLPSSHLSPEGVLSLGQALDGCPHVEEISLAENSLAGGVPRFHQGLPVLRQLDLVSCEIDNQAAKPLAASFVLSWNLLGDEAAAELARVLPQMGRLKRVDLEKNRITAYGAWLLVEGLGLWSLWNNPIPPDMAQHLQNQEPRLDFAFFDNQPQVIPRGT